eukprot:Macronucleus_6232.p2 GENE.Macronucleus_6232~~Macronucleus_6232.p2  ORF type:complete len:117 (+),score=56.35 Macronucleus_6232:1-351(+)
MQSVEIFKKIQPLLESQGAGVVAKVGAVYHFEMRAAKGDKPEIITVDLKNGNGAITFGKEGKADATFIMLDADFVKLFQGKLKPQDAFMNGKMKIRGNMAKAMKFNPSVLPKGAKL